ncbi:MAG: TolC family protein [Agriterribacter sp.]
MKRSLILFYLFFLSLLSFGQENPVYELTLQQTIGKALEHHQQLKVSEANIEARKQQKEVAKLQQMPALTFSANAFYLGDVLLLNPDLSKAGSADLPHFGNTFSLQASQLLYKGGAIRKSVELADLQTQLAELDLLRDEQSVKFLVTSHYLDIYKLLNQKKVLAQNKLLVEQRYANVKKLYEQDMVTRNELVRAELQIKNLEQNILIITNNHIILSNRLSYALALPGDAIIIPTEPVDGKSISPLPYYLELAQQKHPSLLSAKQNLTIAQKSIDITKTELYPAISAFGGYNMQRPLTSSTPALDLYSNTWQAGVGLTYNIDNLFKTKRRVKAGELQKNTIEQGMELSRQNIDMEVTAAFVKYNEALQQADLMRESQRLANENYSIIEAKYLNQLAITAEMTDATTAKLDAELQYANAEINVLFQYYNLLKSTGTL